MIVRAVQHAQSSELGFDGVVKKRPAACIRLLRFGEGP